jgi:cation:H+ antiporter
VAGCVIARSAGALIDRLELSSSLVGALVTAVITSMPELVTTLAAVRRGALQLAVGGIIGGNTFDVLFLTLSDIGYRDGSIYHAIGRADLFWVTVGLAMTAVLLLGLILRERRGPANIGLESLLILTIYGGAIGLQAAG